MFFVSVYQKSQRCSFRWHHKRTKSGQSFTELTVGYHDSVDFNKLPIPFACVSQNIVNGEQIVFHNGILATAMRASMAIPGVFTPVRKDSMILIDGSMINNYPVDVGQIDGCGYHHRGRCTKQSERNRQTKQRSGHTLKSST